MSPRLPTPASAGVRRPSLLGWLTEWQLWALLLVALVCWTMAYQFPYSFVLDPGGNRETHRRNDDLPYIDGFNPDPEPQTGADSQPWWQLEQAPFRWALGLAQIRVPGLGGERWLVTLTAAAPQRPPPTVSIWSDGQRALPVPLEQSARVYHLLASPSSSGDLTLQFETPTFQPPGDSRHLGFVLFHARLQSLAGAQTPAVAQLGWLAGALLLCYGIARRLGVLPNWSLLGGLGLVSGLALTLVLARSGLTIFTPQLCALAFGLWVLSEVLQRLPILQPLSRPQAVLIALLLLAVAFRLGGMLHPHTRFSDLGLNANNLQGFAQRGELFITEGLPASAGGGQQPYPPGQSVVLAPFTLLLPITDSARRLLLILGVGLLDALVVLWIWRLLRAVGASAWMAVLGAALYVLPQPVLNSFSIGEFANISAQALALPALAWLLTAGERLATWRGWCVGLVLLLIAFLGHSGVSISLALLLCGLWMLWWFGSAQRRLIGSLTALGAATLLLIGLVYYSAFLWIATQETVPYHSTLTVAQRLGNGLSRAFGGTWPLLNLALVIIGGAGALLWWRRPAMRWLLLAWWGSAIGSFGVLLVRDRTVRWELFLYPALCLGASYLLAQLWRRGWGGKLLVCCMLCWIAWSGGSVWFSRLADYLHD